MLRAPDDVSRCHAPSWNRHDVTSSPKRVSPAGPAQAGEQGAGIFPHGEGGGDIAGAGPGHESPVGRVVVLGREVEVGEAPLRLLHPVEVVGLAIIGEAGGEGETLGQPAGAAARETRDDDTLRHEPRTPREKARPAPAASP